MAVKTQERAGRQSNPGHPRRVLVMGQAPLKRQQIGKVGQDDRKGIHTCLCVLSTQFTGHFIDFIDLHPLWGTGKPGMLQSMGLQDQTWLGDWATPPLVCLRKVSSSDLGSAHPWKLILYVVPLYSNSGSQWPIKGIFQKPLWNGTECKLTMKLEETPIT